MTRHKAIARRGGVTGVALGLAALLGVGTAAAAYRLTNGTVASAGGPVTNPCYALFSTVGEPAAGTVSNGTYRLTSGFSSFNDGNASLVSDRIFQNGFDGPKDCTP